VPKFPNPPDAAALRKHTPILRTIPPACRLWRIYLRGGEHPGAWNLFRRWGPLPTARYDHHLPPPHLQERGILYAATSIPASVAEVFQARRTIDRVTRNPWLVGFTVTEPLQLLDLTSTWPTAAGASLEMNSGPRPRAQRWSRVIFDAYPEIHGLWYASSMHTYTPVVALYERAEPWLATAPLVHRPLSDPGLRSALARIAAQLDYALI
jgi:hypothetical protein